MPSSSASDLTIAVPILILFHMNGCPHCAGLPGADGPLCSAAGGAGIEYREFERSDPLAQEVREMNHPTLKVEGFQPIGVLTPNSWQPYESGARTQEGVASWLASIISSLRQ